jgi:hypothetical protein
MKVFSNKMDTKSAGKLGRLLRSAIGGGSSNPNFKSVPPGVDVGTLPTLGDLYRAHRGH